MCEYRTSSTMNEAGENHENPSSILSSEPKYTVTFNKQHLFYQKVIVLKHKMTVLNTIRHESCKCTSTRYYYVAMHVVEVNFSTPLHLSSQRDRTIFLAQCLIKDQLITQSMYVLLHTLSHRMRSPFPNQGNHFLDLPGWGETCVGMVSSLRTELGLPFFTNCRSGPLVVPAEASSCSPWGSRGSLSSSIVASTVAVPRAAPCNRSGFDSAY